MIDLVKNNLKNHQIIQPMWMLLRCVWKWWAQYLEFKGRLEEAQKFYSKAEDRVSMTRIYYAIGQPEKVGNVLVLI